MKVILTISLEDCPHCGATQAALDRGKRKGVYAYMDSAGEDHEPTLHVACLECGSGSPSAEVWNRRVNASAVATPS